MSYEPGTALEFFAGIGLARMGLEKAGWRVVFSNDIDAKKLEMYEGHWGADPTYRLCDIFELQADEIPSAELAWASFPCIDLSLAGKRSGLTGSDSSTYWGFYRLLWDMGARRPPLVAIENVPGLINSGKGEDLRRIVESLNELGYICDLVEINALHFVPQSRERIFIVGALAGHALARDGLACNSAGIDEIRTKRVSDFVERHADLRWRAMIHGTAPGARSELKDVLERFPDEADIWWSVEKVEKLRAQMSPAHRSAVDVLTEASRTTFGTVYRRVRPAGARAEVRLDGVAGCLRTPRGGSSKQFVLEMGYGRLRARPMTAVEYGRLQGASDFRITVPYLQALFGFGDAVCVPAVEWLTAKLMEVRKVETDATLAAV